MQKAFEWGNLNSTYDHELGVPRQNAIRWQKWAWFTGSAVLLAVAFD